MRITFLTAAKFKEPSYKELFEMYSLRTEKYANLEYKDLGATHKGKLSEDELLLKYLESKKGSWALVILNERGKLLKSAEFSEKLRKWQDSAVQELIFAVGGAHEFGPELQKKATMLWSLSPMIMAHELAAVVAIEQIYRGYTIMAGHPYHNE